jgi:hypothetical protein
MEAVGWSLQVTAGYIRGGRMHQSSFAAGKEPTGAQETVDFQQKLLAGAPTITVGGDAHT